MLFDALALRFASFGLNLCGVGGMARPLLL